MKYLLLLCLLLTGCATSSWADMTDREIAGIKEGRAAAEDRLEQRVRNVEEQNERLKADNDKLQKSLDELYRQLIKGPIEPADADVITTEAETPLQPPPGALDGTLWEDPQKSLAEIQYFDGNISTSSLNGVLQKFGFKPVKWYGEQNARVIISGLPRGNENLRKMLSDYYGVISVEWVDDDDYCHKSN